MMEQEKIEIWKTALLGETLTFGMLGKVLYQDPDKSWLDSLVRENVFMEVPFGEGQAKTQQGLDLLRGWSEKNSGGISENEFAAIKKDHLYLFTGVGKVLAPIWESVYFGESRLLFQKQTFEVRQWYARFGLQVERKGQEPDDHIGLELSFLAHLGTLALNSLEAGDEVETEKNLQAQRDFLKEHLLRWAIAWASLVEEHGETDFYRGIAHLTGGTLLAAAELLVIEMPKEYAS